MILQEAWRERLQADLNGQQKPECAARLAVLGIGHELYGDDAAGVWLAGRLSRIAAGCENLLVIQGGAAPENYTGVLRKYKPDLVLLVDAALRGLEPGMIGWLDWQDTSGFSASTHTLPLRIIASYITKEFNCEVALLGIQPAQTQFGASLSSKVQKAANEIARSIMEILEIPVKS